MKITKKTSLKSIINFVRDDFGVFISESDAREIKDCIERGVAVWSAQRYVSTITGGISHISKAGVRECARFYSRSEWNNYYA